MSRLPWFVLVLPACAPGVDQFEWQVDEQQIESDACGVWEHGGALEDTGQLDFHRTRSGLAVDLGLEDALHCAEDPNGVRCAPARMEQVVNGTTLSTSIRLHADRQGEDLLSGQYLLEMDCEGPLCRAWSAAISVDFPCQSELGFVAQGF